MKRRKFLATTGTVLSAPFVGCLGGVPGEDENERSHSDQEHSDDDEGEQPISERFNCADANRPEPGVEAGIKHKFEYDDDETIVFESVGSAEYPPPPGTTEDGDIMEFVQHYEAAFRQNELVERYGDELIRFDASVKRTRIIEYRNEIAHVRIDLHIGDEVVAEDGSTAVGQAEVAAAYAIDKTGAVRVETDHQATYGDDESITENTPDPLQAGELVVCF